MTSSHAIVAAVPSPEVVDLTADDDDKGDARAADVSATTAALTAQLAAMTQRAQAAEARAGALERDSRDAERSARNAAAHAAAIVGVKRERLDDAVAAVANAEAATTRAVAALEDAGSCRVCENAPRDMLFVPCMHLFMCEGCCGELMKRAECKAGAPVRTRRANADDAPRAALPCPVCRAPIESMIGPVKFS